MTGLSTQKNAIKSTSTLKYSKVGRHKDNIYKPISFSHASNQQEEYEI
jgi:hypothetical protein